MSFQTYKFRYFNGYNIQMTLLKYFENYSALKYLRHNTF